MTNTNYLIAIHTYEDVAEVRLEAYFPANVDSLHLSYNALEDLTIKPFASLGLTNDELADLFEDDANYNQIFWSADFDDHFDGYLIPERVEEFIGSLNYYAKQELAQHAE